jgi:uncharacterized protein (DUF2235 family)
MLRLRLSLLKNIREETLMRPKKRIVVCCDGTWNDADSAEEFTNVVRIARAIRPYDDRASPTIQQIVYYDAGVGSGGDAINRVAGGALGIGLSRNVRDAYAFLAHNYCDGDEIFLFGFSRGAYTVRSTAGLIGWAGLLHKRDMDDFALLWEGYRMRHKPEQPDALALFPDRHASVPVKCIGVWDTVGALGIPGNFDLIFTNFYKFHDTELGAHVEHAYHALALDEMRPDFAPAIWIQKPEGRAKGQRLRQMWFPGVHSNIGGGYSEHGLSDIALVWMASQVEPLLALDEDYLMLRQDRRSGWGLGKLYESAAGIWKLRGTQIRRPFTTMPQDATFEAIHFSAAVRMNSAAACTPHPYLAPALNGVDIASKLSQLARIMHGPRKMDEKPIYSMH